MNQVTPEMIEELKLVFQTKAECSNITTTQNTKLTEQESRINSIDLRIMSMDFKLKIVIGMLVALLSGASEILPAVFKVLLGS